MGLASAAQALPHQSEAITPAARHRGWCRRKPSAVPFAFAAQAAAPRLLQEKGSGPDLPVVKAAGWTTLT